MIFCKIINNKENNMITFQALIGKTIVKIEKVSYELVFHLSNGEIFYMTNDEESGIILWELDYLNKLNPDNYKGPVKEAKESDLYELYE